jgi:hypothetical protein
MVEASALGQILQYPVNGLLCSRNPSARSVCASHTAEAGKFRYRSPVLAIEEDTFCPLDVAISKDTVPVTVLYAVPVPVQVPVPEHCPDLVGGADQERTKKQE